MYYDEIEILSRVSKGEKIEGYDVIQVGIDEKGRYKDIRTPNGAIKRVYTFGEKYADRFYMADRYNRIHNYRRQDDQIVLYYNTEKGDFIVLAVKEGDNLAESPFYISDSLVVTSKMLNEPELSFPKGIVPITHEFLDMFKEKGILTDELAYVIYYNRKNPGFYL